MSAISAVFTNILAKTPLSASFGKVLLPSSDNEPLVTGKDGGNISEKCELRIEGMTCGSCVEVSAHRVSCAILQKPDLFLRRSKACSEDNQVFIRSRSLYWPSGGSLNTIPSYGTLTNS